MFLSFRNIGLSDSGKTQKWMVYSLNDIPLGEIKWYAQWRRYIFSPNLGTVYDAACLREAADFCEKETARQKA